jgi:hypothetical protein
LRRCAGAAGSRVRRVAQPQRPTVGARAAPRSRRLRPGQPCRPRTPNARCPPAPPLPPARAAPSTPESPGVVLAVRLNLPGGAKGWYGPAASSPPEPSWDELAGMAGGAGSRAASAPGRGGGAVSPRGGGAPVAQPLSPALRGKAGGARGRGARGAPPGHVQAARAAALNASPPALAGRGRAKSEPIGAGQRRRVAAESADGCQGPVPWLQARWEGGVPPHQHTSPAPLCGLPLPSRRARALRHAQHQRRRPAAGRRGGGRR